MSSQERLERKYVKLCNTYSDIFQHLPTLYQYAKQCESIIELGVRGVVSTYAFTLGLMHNNSDKKKLLVNDIEPCPIEELQSIMNDLPIEFQYKWISDLDMVVEENYDMTFIDTFHVYGQLKRELEKYSKITNKYIIMHDTEVDGIYGEAIRAGWNAEELSKKVGMPVDEITKGLLPALDEFLGNNKEWVLEKMYTNNNGLTILRRA